MRCLLWCFPAFPGDKLLLLEILQMDSFKPQKPQLPLAVPLGKCCMGMHGRVCCGLLQWAAYNAFSPWATKPPGCNDMSTRTRVKPSRPWWCNATILCCNPRMHRLFHLKAICAYLPTLLSVFDIHLAIVKHSPASCTLTRPLKISAPCAIFSSQKASRLHSTVGSAGAAEASCVFLHFFATIRNKWSADQRVPSAGA
jgi:hypothetical protein